MMREREQEGASRAEVRCRRKDGTLFPTELATATFIDRHEQRLELNELVRKTLDDYRTLFETEAVQLDLVPASIPLFVDADRNRLAQVVGNLLHNAAKFTPRGEMVKVTLSAETDAQRALIRAADSGVGISQQLLERLLLPFTQADSTLDRAKGGLGLGLALVKGLVELHGGKVAASSAGVDQGSEFVVQLPLEPEALSGPAEPAATPASRHRRVRHGTAHEQVRDERQRLDGRGWTSALRDKSRQRVMLTRFGGCRPLAGTIC
jgi:signal transduction histidine kinase